MKKKLVIILILLVSILVAGYFGLNTYIDSLIEKTEEGEVIKEEEAEIHIVETPKAHEVINFMLVGADNLDSVNGRENSYVEERSDVLKIVSFDYTDREIKLTSLDRDIVIWLPGNRQEFGRFNWAYSFGGPTLAIQTINMNLDLDITKYVTFSFAGFINVIDKIGGVDIELTTDEVDYFTKGSESRMKNYAPVVGTNHLNGYNALLYARLRHLDSDFVRMERQNIVIKAVINKVKTLKFTELLDLVNICLPYINTNLTNEEIKDYLTDLLSFDITDIHTHTYPTYGPDDVCRNKDSMGGYLLNSYSNQVIDLHKFLYEIDDYSPSKEVLEIEKNTYETYGEYYEGSNLIP